MLEIVKERSGKDLTVLLLGRLDTETAPELQAVLEKEYVDTEKLVLDCEKLNYISSAGLRVLMGAQKIMKRRGGMVVKNANDLVREIFDVTGFSNILTIE